MTDLPARGHRRRAVLGSLAVAAAGTPILLAQTSRAAAGTGPAPAAATLMWSPDPATDGLGAFQGVEDDRAHSHPGVTHIYVDGDAYRWDIHTVDWDSPGDRQRQEVRGMAVRGRNVTMKHGETWRIAYDMFMPATLHATGLPRGAFSHIFQLKSPVNGTLPAMTLSLVRNPDREEIWLYDMTAKAVVGSTALAPLRNKWVNVDMTFRLSDNGSARLTIRDGSRTVVDEHRDGIDVWLGSNQLRPKWGIYRSLNAARTDILDTHLLVRNLAAYRLPAAGNGRVPAVEAAR